MLKRVHIRNFKSLGDVTVDLEPVTVLIGRSGTGKTNFVEAFRFLRDSLLSHNVAVGQQRYGGDRLFCAIPAKPHSLLFDLTFDIPGVAGDYQYTLQFSFQPQAGSSPYPEEKLVLGGTVLFHQQGNKWLKAPDVLNPPAAGGLKLGGITGVQEITIAYVALTDGVGCYDFPGTVLTKQAQPQQPQARGLADAADNYVEVFGALVSNLSALANRRDITSALKQLNSSVRNVDILLPGRTAVQVSHDVGAGTLTFDLSQESEGFRRFLAHLLALYQTPPKQTLIFEEPEKGIHPGALATLAEELISCPQAGRGQVILTTHSPQLLDQFSPEMLRVVEKRPFLTAIGPVAPEQLDALREDLLHPGELLTVDQARLSDTLTSTG